MHICTSDMYEGFTQIARYMLIQFYGALLNRVLKCDVTKK